MRGADDGQHLGSGASASQQYKVPGASAPTCNIARIWASMFRWILEARSDFSIFLHSVICNRPSLEEGTAFSIWPMPPPYPLWMRPGNACDKRGEEGTMEKQKALNLIVLNLSWQHLGQPSRAPPALRLGRKLTGRQWAVVRRFDEMLDALLRAGDIGPAEMGRTAAKMEGLEGILQSLHAFAKAAGLDAIAQGSLLRTDAREPSQAPSLRPGALDDAGEVVGVYRGEELINAKDIEPSRLSFPQEKPEFDPTPFLDEQHRQCYDNPTSRAVETEVVEPPPRVQIKASKQQSKDLLRFLDKHKRLTLAPEQKVRADRCCGAFSLLKDAHKDRLIIDARPANAVEPTLSNFTKTLGSISALLQLEMLPGHKLYMSGTDLPVTHRIPLPEVLFKAMVSIAVLWGWMRWAATLTVAFEGIGRIGEAITALRRDLVLPSDSFDTEHLVAFLKIPKPKSRKRGRGRVQHLRIDNVAAVEFLELQFANLHPACKLFPMSAASFRSRWDKILDALQLPRADRPTPSSVRGGGAIAAYRRGETIQGIMWKMRIINQSTLESYLQETAADSLLARMSDPCRSRIRCAARFFPFAFHSPSR